MPKDLILDSDFNIKISNGDLIIGDTTYQNQLLLIYAQKGEFKNSPTSGVGSKLFLENHKPDDFAREIRQEFIADGMTVKSILINDKLEVNIDAFYKL